MDPEDFLPIARALQREKVEYVLVGGVALAFQGLARATKDLDLFVRPTDDNIDRLKKALRAVFNDESVNEIKADELAGEYAVVRYGPPDVDYIVDVIGHIGEVWWFDDIEREQMEIQGLEITLATPRMLYRMKRDTVRPRDQMDAAVLKQKFNLEDD
jgi:hypothetical protein